MMFHAYDEVFHRRVPEKYRYLSADEIKEFVQIYRISPQKKVTHLQITMQDTKKILNSTEQLLILQLQIITPIYTDTMYFPHSQ